MKAEASDPVRARPQRHHLRQHPDPALWQNSRWLTNPTAGSGLARCQAVIGAFRASALEFDLDPLLLLAQVQIRPSTASARPISIKDVSRLENNVRAGAKYLRFIIDRYYSDSTIAPLDGELFAMASYNGGPARVAGLRREVREAGLDPDRKPGAGGVGGAGRFALTRPDHAVNSA